MLSDDVAGDAHFKAKGTIPDAGITVSEFANLVLHSSIYTQTPVTLDESVFSASLAPGSESQLKVSQTQFQDTRDSDSVLMGQWCL